MADFSFEFDADQVEATQPSFDLIPDGTKCWFELVEADIVKTEDQTGEMLTYTAEIKAGDYERRKVWGRINILNKSEEAQKIGQGQLAALCKAMGISRPSCTEDMLAIPFEGTIGIEKGDRINKKTGRPFINPKTGQPYPDRNVIKYYKPAQPGSRHQEAAPRSSAVQQAAPRPAPTPAPAAKKKPWEVAA